MAGLLRHPVLRVPLVSLGTGLVFWALGKVVDFAFHRIPALEGNLVVIASAAVMTVLAAVAFVLCGALFFRDMTRMQTLGSALLVSGYSFFEAGMALMGGQVLYGGLPARAGVWLAVPVQLYQSLVSLLSQEIELLLDRPSSLQLVMYAVRSCLPLLFSLFAWKRKEIATKCKTAAPKPKQQAWKSNPPA